jgi:adenylate cyclase
MAFWNAPEPVADHVLPACRAALRCRAALQALYDSPEWQGAPRFETRFGLHRCEASVGHFGSPDRFNYTAIGDGINLASRLEGLNNHYGTTIIASETVRLAAREHFEFRLLDRVAVKGKAQCVTIFELSGEKKPGAPRPLLFVNYERAFEAYQRGEFQNALALLDVQLQDPPSRVLAERCREYSARPPSSWDGIHVFGTRTWTRPDANTPA